MNATEDLSKVATTKFLIFIAERCYIVILRRLAGLNVGDSLAERLVGVIIGQRLENIGNRNLEGHVHTALQVKTKSQLFFTNFLERVVAQVHLLLSDFVHIIVVLLLIGGVRHIGKRDMGFGHGQLLTLILIAAGYEGE